MNGKLDFIKSIQNWDERIQFGRYKQENVSILKLALSKFDEYEQTISNPDWKILTEDKKENLKIWQRTSANGLKCMKAVSHLDRSPDDVIRVIGDSSYRNDYDPVYDFSDFLVKVADQTFVVY